MRIVSIITAILVTAVIFFFVFQRDWTRDQLAGETDVAAESVPAAAVEETAPAPQSDPGDVKRVAVVAMTSTAQPLASAVIVRGETDAARQVNLLSETSGTVISTPLRRGANVKAGDVMCELDPGTRMASLAEAKARLAEAKARVPETQSRVAEAEARLEEALINFNAADKLAKDGFASDTRLASATATTKSARAGVEAAKSALLSTQAAIESAEAGVAAAQKEIERLKIKASFDGILESDTAELGSLLQPGALCATVIQLDPIKLVGFVPEVDVNRVVLGAKAGGRLAAGGDLVGEVTFVSKSSDPTTRTFRVEIDVPNPDLAIRDGQTADILIESQGTSAHLIPGSALTLNNNGDLGLRIVDETQTARFVPVDLIRDTKDGVWVTGLGDQADVIVVGQEFVKDGVPVTPTYR
ncbi:MAG: efflux RND transporter periplasmic adaptor subunit [Planktomarina sp.]